MADEKANNETAPKENEESQKNQQESKQSDDLEQVKVMAALAYFGILFFLPLVTHPNSSFGKFHANQGLMLLLFNIVVSFVLTVTIIGVVLLPILYILTLVLFIMGIMNALNLKKKRLPLIGGFDIIK